MDGAVVTDDENDRSTANPTAAAQDAYANFAFLVRSQTSLMQDLAPKVDTAMTARQKRRRTSPEDHAVLEAAYQENSKPDKSERMEIVKRVTLSEKEVQIWFQNRRQNDRRKSRPLLPHEMVPHFRNSVPQVLLDSALPGNIASTQLRCSPWLASEIPRPTGVDGPERSSSRASSIHDLLNPPYSTEDQTTISSDTTPADKVTLQASQSSTSASQPALDGKLQKGEENEAATSQDAKLSPGGLKRTHDEMIEKERAAKDVSAVQIPSLSSQSSHVRLSISLEGAVKVKTTEAETPSPHKQRAPPPTVPSGAPAGLQRSKSVFPLNSKVSQESAGKPKVKSVGGQFGRSRDARTWEFYCDGNAREALSAHAEDERTGSAVGAINLIRSQSQTSRAQTMTERSGGSNPKNPPMSQRTVKHKLSRARSSMARLQDTNQTSVKPSMKEADPSVLRSPSGDSDKENWAPGTRLLHHPLRRQHASANRRSILGDEDHRLNRARSTGGLATDQKRSSITRQPVVIDKENIGHSGRHQRLIEAAGKGEDLDCIQGLLSLSQGAWQ